MNKSQIKIGAILSYISIALNIVAGLLYTPWMVDQIGESDYGLYTLANSLITLFLVDFGLSAATSRFVSKYVAEGRQDKADSFLGAVYKLYFIIDALICAVLLVMFFFLEHIYVSLSPIELQKFKAVYCIAAGFAVVNFPFVTLNGILTSYEKFIQLKLADIIHRLCSVGLTVWALYDGLGLYALVAANAASGLVTLLYKFVVVKKSTPVRVDFGHQEKTVYKSIFSFSAWTTVAILAQRLIFNITPTVLGIVSNSAQIAVFGIVTTLEAYCYTFTTAINGMFLPRISKIYSREQSEQNIMPLMINVGRFQFAINGLLIVGFTVLGRSFIKLWMGDGFGDAYIGVLLVIIPGLFFNSLQVANTAMIVQNKVKEQAIIALVCGFVNIISSMFFSSIFGAIGACISIFVAYSIRAVLYHIVLYKKMQIDILQFTKMCYAKMLPALLISLLGGMLVDRLDFLVGWMELVVKGVSLVLIYLISVIIFGLNSSERKSFFHYNL